MPVATTTEFWDARLNGEDPTDPDTTNANTTWTKTGSGSPAVSGGAWRVSDNDYNIVPTTTAYSMVASLSYNSAPSNGEQIMFMDNGTYSVAVQVAADGKFSLVGATTATTADLDPDMGEEVAVPTILRLTLTAAGTARLYPLEIIEDDDGNSSYLEITATNDTSGSKKIEWGNNSGTVDWYNVYATTKGAFSPDELALSAFTTNTLLRMGISTIDILKDSKRTYLKNIVSDSAIRYGYDISNQMITRLTPPSIHVLLKNVTSPSFEALSGTRVKINYDVSLFITTRGTDYKNAYRLGLNIMGDCFDELYLNTGLNGTTDSLINFTAEFDTKMDDDEVICVHVLTLTYMRQVSMLNR